MKILLMLPLLIVFAAGSAFAHAPNAIEANYDKSRDQLNVKVQHLVNSPLKHFVREVTVYKNGRKAWSQNFDFQTSHRNLTMPPIELPAIDGDTLRIVANCSEGGRGERTITIGVVERMAPTGPIEHDIAK